MTTEEGFQQITTRSIGTLQREVEEFQRDLYGLIRHVRENDGRAFIRDLVLAAMILLIAASQVALLLIVRGMR